MVRQKSWGNERARSGLQNGVVSVITKNGKFLFHKKKTEVGKPRRGGVAVDVKPLFGVEKV